MSGLLARSSTAGHDEIRDTDRLIKFTRSKAQCVRRSGRHRDIVPRVHHALAPCRLIPAREAGIPFVLCSRHDRGCLVRAAFDEKRPDCAGNLVSQRDGYDLIWPACHQRDDPRGQLYAPASLFQDSMERLLLFVVFSTTTIGPSLPFRRAIPHHHFC